jgi:hypothetical protein
MILQLVDPSFAQVGLTNVRAKNRLLNGRSFIVEMTSGDELHKIQMRIQEGKMKEVIGKEIITEGQIEYSIYKGITRYLY